MVDYFCIPTTIGAAKLAQAGLLGQKLQITHVGLGDGNPDGVAPDQNTVLVSERYRRVVDAVYSPPEDLSVVIVEMAVPVEEGDWDVNEVGLFDSVGDLIAIANYPKTWKPKVYSGTGRVLLIRVMLDVGNAESVTLKIDPAAVMATRQYADNVAAAALEEAGNRAERSYLAISKNLSDVPDKAAARQNLGVKSVAESDQAYLAISKNLSDVPDKAAARQNLGVKSGIESDQAYLAISKNLSDVPNKAAARVNLGIPVNTVLKGRTGWHLDADTGLLKQWGTTGLLGDFPGSAVTRAFTFPLAFTGGVNFVHPITRQYSGPSGTAASTITHAVIDDPTATGFSLITTEYDGNVQSYGIDWYAEGFI